MIELSREALIRAAEDAGKIADEAQTEAARAAKMAKIMTDCWMGDDYAAEAHKKRIEARILTIAAACMLERASVMSSEARLCIDVVQAEESDGTDESAENAV